mmetsp:Transcript_214/g.530  ORF Transcript_214/g.530 Transcript_214/m.530 type:complete len:206 (-) Transcript_214:634-1251(-)
MPGRHGRVTEHAHFRAHHGRVWHLAGIVLAVDAQRVPPVEAGLPVGYGALGGYGEPDQPGYSRGRPLRSDNRQCSFIRLPLGHRCEGEHSLRGQRAAPCACSTLTRPTPIRARLAESTGRLRLCLRSLRIRCGPALPPLSHRERDLRVGRNCHRDTDRCIWLAPVAGSRARAFAVRHRCGNRRCRHYAHRPYDQRLHRAGGSDRG